MHEQLHKFDNEYVQKNIEPVPPKFIFIKNVLSFLNLKTLDLTK